MTQTATKRFYEAYFADLELDKIVSSKKGRFKSCIRWHKINDFYSHEIKIWNGREYIHDYMF